MRQRRQPQRTCITCRTISIKRELLRIVRTPSGEVVLDATGKLSGRGAYVCRRRSCILGALQRDRIVKALEVDVSEESRSAIEAAASSYDDEPQAVANQVD
ncbi:MAG: YlxR family protein [Chloroflexi bacterium]|nr:YlxR family protein [Chloroflexota bacterium]